MNASSRTGSLVPFCVLEIYELSKVINYVFIIVIYHFTAATLSTYVDRLLKNP